MSSTQIWSRPRWRSVGLARDDDDNGDDADDDDDDGDVDSATLASD